MKRKAVWMLPLAFFFSHGVCAQSASPTPSSSTSTSASSSRSLPAQVAPTASQREVFDYLKEKCGREVAFPTYPDNALLSWASQGFATAGSDKKLLYPVVYEQLLAAQQLLASHDKRQIVRGLRVSYDSYFKISVLLEDTWLTAHLFDGFIMPYVFAAKAGGRSGVMTQQSLLRYAAGSYKEAGEHNKQLRALRWLLKVALQDKAVHDAKNPNSESLDADGATNDVDWAHIKLADCLAAQEEYREAIDNLNAIKSPNMSGAKQWIPELQKKLQEQERKKLEARTAFRTPTPQKAAK